MILDLVMVNQRINISYQIGLIVNLIVLCHFITMLKIKLKRKVITTFSFKFNTYLLRPQVSSHSLKIQTGRYVNDRLPRMECVCAYCKLILLMTS